MADINYTYLKKRKDFGRQPMFCEAPVQMLDSINPNISEQKKYGLRNPVNHDTQAYFPQSEHYVNTKRVTMQTTGVEHAEGGWPKDVNIADEEVTSRYRRRIERDDNYVDAILNLYPDFYHYIKQNNSIEMYQMFFKGMKAAEPVEKSSLRVNNVYRDPGNRPTSCINWTLEDDPKMVVAYCDKRYPITGPRNNELTCYLWNVENPNNPLTEFYPPTSCWQVACSPVQPNCVLGGLADGRVCIFDIRAKKEAVTISPTHLAHRDPVSALIYLVSRLNTEFFSGSTDGKCMWWDVRSLSEPIDSLIMSVRIPPGQQISLANAEPVSALQYERSFPTRFLCGTDTGLVINVNRKGKTHQEMMSGVFEAHRGAVKAVQRSPCTSKMFVTCGDWTVHIWSDDVKISPIVTGIPHRYPVSDVVWAPQRFSSYMTISVDGKFEYWDFLRKYHEPIIQFPVCKHSLQKIAPTEDGRFVAIGDIKGALHLISLSENLVIPGEKDRQLMAQTYERETRREHILESRVKEIRLKLKAEEEGGGAQEEVVDEEALIKSAEDDYKKMVLEEIRRTGYTYATTPARSGQRSRSVEKMRKR